MASQHPISRILVIICVAIVSLYAFFGRKKTAPRFMKAATPSNPTATSHDNSKERIAILIPFIGTSFPPYFPMFCTAAGGSSSLVDFFIFHDGITLVPSYVPSNVKLVDMESPTKMAELFALKVLKDKSEDELEFPRTDLIRILAGYMKRYPYVLVEFKAAYGVIFEDYIKEYSHWGYGDLDILFGDLPRWISEEELRKFDIVTYGYGDQDRIYLRGQFTFHKNNAKIKDIWRGCKFLSNIDGRFARVASGQDKLKFESAEGCYSQMVLRQTDIKVKYAVKAFTDVTVTESDTAHTHGLFTGIGKKGDRSVLFKAGAGSHGGAELMKLPSDWFESHEDYSDLSKVLQWEVGRRRRVQTHRTVHPHEKVRCMYWAPAEYQPDLCAVNVDSTDTVLFIDGILYKQKHQTMKFSNNVVSYPFFHFQEWKRYYRSDQVASFRHRDTTIAKGWVLSKEGAMPLLPHTPTPTSLKMETRLLKTHISNWVRSSKIDRNSLPTSSYCLRSSRQKSPPEPITSNCDKWISWQDTQQVTILNHAPNWEHVNFESDVTLLLTLDVSPSDTPQTLLNLISIADRNIRIWDTQPAILLLHVRSSSTPDATKELIKHHYDPENYPHRNCLVAVIFSTDQDRDIISLKALGNMVTDASPTRFVLSGLELERGLLLSEEAAYFAVRKVRVHGDVPGNVFVVPQVASHTLDFVNKEGEGGMSIMSFLRAEAAETTTELNGVDCRSCRRRRPPIPMMKTVDDQIYRSWRDATLSTVDPQRKRSHSSASSDRKRTVWVQSLLEMAWEENQSMLQQHDITPLLLFDRIGPRNGMITSDLVSQVEALGGTPCFNSFLLVQFAMLGYAVDVLDGAFAVSFPWSRELTCDAETDREDSSVLCDGCVMFEGEEELLDTIVKEERVRLAKMAVLWDDLDRVE